MSAQAVRISSISFIIMFATVSSSAARVELKQKTVEAFERLLQERQARQTERLSAGRPFLWVDEAPGRAERARRGEILVSPLGNGQSKVPNGLVHEWIGAVFIPGATLQATLDLLHDYDNHKYVFGPDVVESRLISQNGNEYRTYLRVIKKKVITVAFDAHYDVRYYPVDARRWRSETRSTQIRELEKPGTPEERLLPEGAGRGLLWRINTWTRFEERDGGVYVESEVMSLSRGYPFGIGWAVKPIVRDVPGEGLTETLTAMRNAVLDVQQGRLSRRPLRAE